MLVLDQDNKFYLISLNILMTCLLDNVCMYVLGRICLSIMTKS